MGGMNDPQATLDAKKKLRRLRQKLEEIEEMKKMEPQVRRDIIALVNRLGPDADTIDAEDESSEDDKDDGGGNNPQKRLKALNKKLSQITKLKGKKDLDPEAAEKLASEPKILKEIAALKAGLPFCKDTYEQEMKAKAREQAELPTDKEAVEKRLKALRKKLQQIAALKEKTEALDAEAKAKVESERYLLQEVAALERGDAVVKFLPPTEDEKIEAASQEKINVEKKIKNVRKKLAQITALKEKSAPVSPDEEQKIKAEAGLKKELGALERELGALNKAERERVSKKLGL